MKAPSRLDTSVLARWWWSVDRLGLMLLAAMVVVGFVMLLAAGPAAAARLGIADKFHFPIRQLVFMAPTLMVIFAVSMMTPLEARRLGVVTFLGAFLAMVYLLLFGAEINGAKRWIGFGSFGLQPSEFLKPGFVIAAAWMLSERARNPQFPGALIAMGVYGACALMLILQPDYGQASLLTAVWMVMFFVAGWSWLWIAGLGSVGLGAVVAGYYVSPHVARRIDAFVSPGTGETYQVDRSLAAIQNGGAFGRPGDAPVIKNQLPDSHSDFIFAVAGEEFGFVFCVFILLLLCGFVVRAFARASMMKSLFAQTAVCGLAAMVGLQSFVNIGAALRALPAKGMTLPFMSYGGSSLLAMGLAMGLIFALTRAPKAAARRREIMA